ncbi:hypothetical protein ElyMa_001158100 [Elysia marginata]|uniref:Uncharacterized protein n=1 Tax=Elysia marginata TaxID=1093978 RepID=A0AAV4I157_9GAST|nr:hypothetical protein ElyMa_001158100 [Elysia marginata]
MPAARGRKRKGAKAKNEGVATTKKPCLPEDSETHPIENCSSELSQDDQDQEEKAATGPVDPYKKCLTETTEGNSKTTKVLDGIAVDNENLEEPKNKKISKATLEDHSLETKSKELKGLETCVEETRGDQGSSQEKFLNKEDEDGENPLEMMKNVPQSEALALDIHSENLYDIAHYGDSGHAGVFRPAFLSASQPVTSSRNSNSLHDKLSKRFKPPPRKNDLCKLSKQHALSPKQERPVSAKEIETESEIEASLGLGSTDLTTIIFKRQRENLKTNVSEFENAKDQGNLEIDEMAKNDERKEMSGRQDRNNSSKVGNTSLQHNAREKEEHDCAKPFKGDQSHRLENQHQPNLNTLHKNKAFEKSLTEVHVDYEESKYDESHAVNISLQPNHGNQSMELCGGLLGAACVKNKEKQLSPSSSDIESAHTSGSGPQKSLMSTQGFVADPSNSAITDSSESIKSSGDNIGDNKNKTGGHTDRPARNKFGVEMFGPLKPTNTVENMNHLSFSPLLEITDRSSTNQKPASPVAKLTRQTEPLELDNTDGDKPTVRVMESNRKLLGQTEEMCDTECGKQALQDLENPKLLGQVESTVIPESNCHEPAVPLTENPKLHRQADSTVNTNPASRKTSHLLLEPSHMTATKSDQEKGEKNLQHLKTNKIDSSVSDVHIGVSNSNKTSPSGALSSLYQNEAITNVAKKQKPLEESKKVEACGTPSEPVYDRDPTTKKTEGIDDQKDQKLDNTLNKTVPKDCFLSDSNVSEQNRKLEEDPSTLYNNAIIKADKIKDPSDSSFKFNNQPALEKKPFNCVSPEYRLVTDSSISNIFNSVPQPQIDVSCTESSDSRDTKDMVQTAMDTETLCQGRNINIAKQIQSPIVHNSLNQTSKSKENNQAYLNTNTMTADEILDIISEPTLSLTDNVRSGEIRFTTKTQSYTISKKTEDVNNESERNPSSLEDPLTTMLLDDIQSSMTEMGFGDLDTQTFLLDENEDRDRETNQEELDRFENEFQKNQEAAAQQANVQRTEGASIVKAIMGDLMSMNRQLLKMKKEMDIVTRSLGRIGKQEDTLKTKGGRSVGGW